ncbi:MAG: hypothetical protein KAI95_15495, partial [Bacteroidales bacterium]|nr:hypothetical protein [Bacteroidales bacterium]
MRQLFKNYLIAIFLLFAFFSVSAQNHPRILVDNDDKRDILSKIESQAWAKELYGGMLEKIEPIADRHARQTDWILSRYQMYRVPGKQYTDFYTDPGGTALIRMEGNAPGPTIRGTTHKRPPLDPEGFRFRVPELEEFPVYDTAYEMFLQSTA